MVKTLSQLPVGAKIKDANTKYNGATITWLVGGRNHYGANQTALVSEKIISLKAFDAIETRNTDSNRKNYGNNRYSQSNIRQWLNSSTTSWYSAQHSADAPPNNANVYSNYNEYDAEPGFLTNFSENMRNALVPTTLTVAKNTVTDGGGSETVSDKVFLLSNTEVGLTNENSIAEGKLMSLFSTAANRIAKPTATAVSKSEYKDTTNLLDSKAWYYWLRTPSASYSSDARYVNLNGSLSGSSACGGYNGVRPAINITSTIAVSDVPDTDGAYTLIFNNAPTINVTSPSDARTLYENDTFAIAGTTTDADNGNVVSVKYSIDGGATQAITASVSAGTAISFAKNLVYKSGKLYDGATAITSTLAEGSQHTLKVWAEDDQGGKSTEIIRTFYVVPNRAATLTLDAFVTRTGLINSDVVNISGTVADLDNGNVIVKYKIGNGAYTQVFNGIASATPTPFSFNILLADLVDGANQITIQAVDAYSAVTQQVITLNKTANEEPLKTAVTYYEITPPNGTADGLQLYVERELGDLVVTADVFMGDTGATEVFKSMTLASSANLTNGNVEDTFSYEHGADAAKFVVRITMTRTSTATNKAIKKISGVLS